MTAQQGLARPPAWTPLTLHSHKHTLKRPCRWGPLVEDMGYKARYRAYLSEQVCVCMCVCRCVWCGMSYASAWGCIGWLTRNRSCEHGPLVWVVWCSYG